MQTGNFDNLISNPYANENGEKQYLAVKSGGLLIPLACWGECELINQERESSVKAGRA